MDAQIAVVMVPLPAQGHLNQLLHLSHILACNGIPVYYACSAIHNRQAKLRLHGWDPVSSSEVQFHDCQLPFSSPAPSVGSDSHFPTHLQPLFDGAPLLRQPVFQLVQELSTKFRRVVVIHDNMMGSVVQDVKTVSNVECYIFVPCCAFTLFFGIWGAIPEKPFELDSDTPASIIPSYEGCFAPEVLSSMGREFQHLDFQSGFIYNTCWEIEGKYIDLVQKVSMNPNMKHFAIGPFHPVELKNSSRGVNRHACLEWLDRQEKDSVIYISFGSTTVMTDEQIRELAVGLEESGQKFIWVLKNADRVDIFAEGEPAVPRLPEGYEMRVKDRGLVLQNWAPQLETLAHPSTGGFMSHCGWNSCIESISSGVPIAAWPMHSDQPRNAVLITEVLKIGSVVRDWACRAELVKSDTIQNVVQELMALKKGKEIRARAAELGKAVRNAVAAGGTSHTEIGSFIDHINR